MSFLYLAEASTVVTLVSLAVTLAAAGASYALARRNKPHGNTPLEDFALTNLATQGAFVPLLIGRKRVGPIVAWAGDRQVIHLSQTVKKNKGLIVPLVQHFDQTKRVPTGQILYSEAAWHLLCVGPALKIHRIWAGGELIFPDANSGYSAPLDSTNHPSGTSIAISAGEFDVYWGEPDQPVNTFLSDSTRVGVASRWPHVCSVVWTRYGLQTSPSWPQLEYEVEVTPYNTVISDAIPFVDQVYEDAGATPYDGANLGYALAQIAFESYPHGVGLPLADFDYTAGAAGGDTVLDRIHTTPVGSFADGAQSLTGEAAGDPASIAAGTYDLAFVAPAYNGGGMDNGTNWVGFYLSEYSHSGELSNINVYLQGPSGQKVYLRQISSYSGELYDGVDDFGSWVPPAGVVLEETLGLAYVQFSATEVTLDETGIWDLHVDYDVNFIAAPDNYLGGTQAQVTLTEQDQAPTGSIYELIELVDTEGLAGAVLAQNGEEAGNILGAILQDVGAFMPTMCDGRIGIVPLREVSSANVIQLDQDQVHPPVAEIETIHADRAVDRAMFSFSDTDRNYRETVVQIDEDGQPARTSTVRGSVIPLATIADYEVAAKVAERRSQEELSRGARYSLNLSRGIHRLLPGRVISVPNVGDYLRVMSVRLSDTADVAEVECLSDFYGVQASDYVHPSYPSNGYTNTPAAANLQEALFEVPEHAGERGTVLVVPLRIRAGAQVLNQLVHLSNTGSSYDLEGSSGGIVSGGTLDEALAADTAWVIDQGPEITLVGLADDLLDHFDDLTTDEAAWRSGRQLALIGDELFYVAKVTAISGSTYRLDGLIRARLDTQMAAHAINDEVFLFSLYNADTFGGPKVYPGADLYVKQQPIAAIGPLSLASVSATNKTLSGKGVRPMRPGALRVTAPAMQVPAYSTGEDVTFRWCYRSSEFPGTGAGLQPFGQPVGVSAIQGEFEVEVYNTGDTLVATYDVGAVETWTYTNANLQTDLGSEVGFYVLLRNVNGSLRSDSVRLDVEKL